MVGQIVEKWPTTVSGWGERVVELDAKMRMKMIIFTLDKQIQLKVQQQLPVSFGAT